MKAGDKLTPLNGNAEGCKIIHAPKPPSKWRVRYDSGKEKNWSKTHLKKYYKVV